MIDPSHDPRMALEITRYHTWRRIRDQSIGEHSMQIMRILLAIWPDAPRRMLVHCLLHDIGEMAGDVPFPHKRDDPVLKERMDVHEEYERQKMQEAWHLPSDVLLSRYEETVFKLADTLESWECCVVEMRMGNKYATIMAMRMILVASAMIENLTPEGGAPDIRPAVKRYVDARREQEFPELKNVTMEKA